MAGTRTSASWRTETAHRDHVRKALKKAGAVSVVQHQAGRGRRGVADLVACYRGIFLALEIKLPGRPHPLSALQAAFLREINTAGGIGVVLESPGDVERLLKAIDEGLDVASAARACFTIDPETLSFTTLHFEEKTL